MENNRYCYIEVLGEEVEDAEKCGSNHIKIVREILGEELDMLLGKVNGNTGYWNGGEHNTGDNNAGAFNAGSYNVGNWNAGDGNVGYGNTGNNNTGNWNTGNWNKGEKNAGNDNAGNHNTGRYNVGNWNTGDFNSCDFSNGVFCSEEPKINIFNKPSQYTMKEFMRTEYYDALRLMPIWLITLQMEAVDYKTACIKGWAELHEKYKKIIRSMPNFDAEVFEKITGIKEEE